MLTSINAASLRAPLNDGAAPSHSGGDPSSDPAGFSSLLRQTQAAPPAPKAAPPAAAPAQNEPPQANAAPTSEAPPATEQETDKAPDAPEAADPTSRTRAPLKPRLRATDTAVLAAQTEPKAAPEKAATGAEQGEAKTAVTPAAIDPAIAQWLAAAQRPAPAEKGGAPRAEGADKPEAAATETTRLRPPDAAAMADETKSQRGAGLERVESAPAFAAALAEQRVAEPAPVSHASAAPSGVTASALAPTSSAPRDIAAPVVVALPTPVNAPDFAQTLGVQMSVLAKDGVQQAELHLNPAEMGPVSVQIVMDGTQARIDFGADMAATRHAIEAGLPELASALRDAGFTLAGGGVSQHSRGRSDGSQPDGGSARREPQRADDATLTRVGNAARRIVSRGGVDLYA